MKTTIFLLVSFLCFLSSGKGNNVASDFLVHAPGDKHPIPVRVKGWSGIFEMDEKDNTTENGVLMVHVVLSKEGKITSLTLISSNLSKQMAALYIQRMKETWRVIGFSGNTAPETTEADIDLHVEHY